MGQAVLQMQSWISDSGPSDPISAGERAVEFGVEGRRENEVLLQIFETAFEFPLEHP